MNQKQRDFSPATLPAHIHTITN